MRTRLLAVIAGALLAATLAAPARAQSAEPGATATSAPPAMGWGSVELSVDGQPVKLAPIGARVVATLDYSNGGGDTERNVTLHVTGPPSNATMIDALADFGDVAPGASAKGSVSFTLARDGCADEAAFSGTLHRDGMDDIDASFSVPVACPGPRLWVQGLSYSGGNGDQVPDPGETLKIFVTLANRGRDAATGVRATLTVAKGDPVTIVTGETTWPDIAPGDSATNTHPLEISIAADAKREVVCGGPMINPTPGEATPPDAGTGAGVAPGRAAPGAAPGSAAPAPGTTGAPEPTGTPSASRPPVVFDATLHVTASGITSDVPMTDVVVCNFGGIHGVNPGGPLVAPSPGGTAEFAAGDAARATRRDRNGPLAIGAVLLAAAMAATLRYAGRRRARSATM